MVANTIEEHKITRKPHFHHTTVAAPGTDFSNNTESDVTNHCLAILLVKPWRFSYSFTNPKIKAELLAPLKQYSKANFIPLKKMMVRLLHPENGRHKTCKWFLLVEAFAPPYVFTIGLAIQGYFPESQTADPVEHIRNWRSYH